LTPPFSTTNLVGAKVLHKGLLITYRADDDRIEELVGEKQKR